MSQGNVKDPVLGNLKPRGTRRVIYNSDLSNTICHLSDPAAQPVELRTIVRNYAVEGNIDTLVQEIFAESMTQFWRTDKCPYDVRYWHQRLVPMMNAGLMPVEVYIDECHKQEMEFIAGFRMNDRHGQHPDFFEKLAKENPDWILTDYEPSWKGAPERSHKYGCSLNYAVEGVRDFLFSIMEDAVKRFDLDGIEFNYTRLAECFPLGEAEASHEIMTDFIRRVRKMLDREAKESPMLMLQDHGRNRNTRPPEEKNRKMIFGVRVPQQLEGCKKWGFDVLTWIKEGLIDYVAPGDFGFTDFNERYEDFVSLARAHDCYVYPQVQTRLGVEAEIDMDPSRYRAAVGNFYGAGADGFSTQNYFFHWEPKSSVPGEDGVGVPEMYPKALNFLKELRSPESITTAGDRHYVFLPLWADWDGGGGMSGIYKREEIILKRNKIGERDEFRFRVCENFPSELTLPTTDEGGGLTFFVAGLVKGDELEVDINGEEIATENLKWNWYDDERPPSCRLPLSSPRLIYGDNYLGLKIKKNAPEAEGDIIVERLECVVQADW